MVDAVLANAKTRLFDLTRLINRAGLHPAGVDRVERAYLRELVSGRGARLFGLARTALGYVLLDHDGCSRLAEAVETGDWGKADIVSRLNPRLDGPRRRGQSFVRSIAVARTRKSRLSAMLDTHLPRNTSYLNVGHSNLDSAMFSALGGLRKVILIHDTIPLDFPETQRVGAVAAFRKKLALVSRHADQVICTSAQCEADVTRWFADMGRVPPITTALLGIDVPEVDPDFLVPKAPYFVCVGTIEPRKNHALLFDIWDDWGPDAPPLIVCGKRGWNNDAVFARLDAGIPQIVEMNDLSDGQIGALLQNATAMLFPSYSEGFGLPPAEALALGCRVLCADLPVYGEILGNHAVYASHLDRYLWEKTIKKLATAVSGDQTSQYDPPTWAAHFKAVLTAV